MRRIFPIAALAWGTVAGFAQENPPEPAPTPQATAATNSPKIKEAVDLSAPAAAENLEIPPPDDQPGADQAEEIEGFLPDEEPTAPRPAVTGEVEVTSANAGKVVRAAVGNLVNITLQSNPGTGYSWELRDFDYGAADFYKSETVADDGGNVLLGAPARTIITLQAVKPGMQDIKLVYRRIWEPPDQVAETFEFRLAVGGDGAMPAADPSSAPSAPRKAPSAP